MNVSYLVSTQSKVVPVVKSDSVLDFNAGIVVDIHNDTKLYEII